MSDVAIINGYDIKDATARTALADKLNLAPIVVEDGTDIDTVLTPGIYWQNDGTKVSTITNMPESRAFIMYVYKLSSSSGIQRITYFNGHEYVRWFNISGVAQSWHCVSGADVVIESGTSGIWKYDKYESGKLILTTTGQSETVSITSASGNLYLGTLSLSLPSIVYSASFAEIWSESNTYFISGGSYFSGTSTVSFNLFRAGSRNGAFAFGARVTGAWK